MRGRYAVLLVFDTCVTLNLRWYVSTNVARNILHDVPAHQRHLPQSAGM